MGELYALVCALLWALAVILLKRSGETVPPLALNLFRVLASIPLILATLAVRGLSPVRHVPGGEYLILAASGILGITIADTLFLKSLNMVGAGVTAILDTFYSPMMVFFAWALLDERIGLRDFAGMGLIMSAVFLSATFAPPPRRSRRELIQGIGLGLLGLVFLSVGIVIAKPVLNHSPVLWVAGVRQVASGAALLVAALLSPRRRTIFTVFRPSPSWRYMVPATILGSYLSLLFWIAGMKYTLASIAAILNQSSTVFILIFAVAFLGEPVSRRKALSAALALAGVLLVTIH